jgi:hypothetical protein
MLLEKKTMDIRHCFVCGTIPEHAESLCPRCQHAVYCSELCQDADWRVGGHAFDCYDVANGDLVGEVIMDIEAPFHSDEENEEDEREIAREIIKNEDVQGALDWLYVNRMNHVVASHVHTMEDHELRDYHGDQEMDVRDRLIGQIALDGFKDRIETIGALEWFKEKWAARKQKTADRKVARKDARGLRTAHHEGMRDSYLTQRKNTSRFRFIKRRKLKKKASYHHRKTMRK